MVAYLFKIYLDSAQDALYRLKRSWSVLAGIFVLILGFIFVSAIARQLGFIGGILLSIYQALAITFYLGWLRDSRQSQRLRFEDLKELDWGIFQSVISILFILWIFDWVLVMLGTGMESGWSSMILQLLIVVLLNSIPETLYLTNRDGMDAVQESFSFTTRNWIEWFLPYLVLLSPLLLLGGASLPLLLSQANVFFPSVLLISVPSFLFPGLSIISIPMGLVLAHWFMLFRGKLYQELDVGSRRQRMFKSKMS